jgi:serine/threonine protein kinase
VFPSSDIVLEIATLKRLTHPNIVEIVDVVQIDDTIGIVQPLAYTNLYYYVREQYLTQHEKDRIVYEVLCGISYLHSKQIAHRDIKPGNILVYLDRNSVATVKVADFGLSQSFACKGDIFWDNDVYTLWYRPPEILNTVVADYDMSADIWALAATIWEIYTTRPLFLGTSVDEMIKLVDSELMDYKRVKRLNIPKIVELVESALIYDKTLRPMAYALLSDAYFNHVRNFEYEGEYPLLDCAVSIETRDVGIASNYIDVLSDENLTEESRNLVVAEMAVYFTLMRYPVKVFLSYTHLLDLAIINVNPKVLDLKLLSAACLTITLNVVYGESLEPMDLDTPDCDSVDIQTHRELMLTDMNYDLLYTVSYDYYTTIDVDSLPQDKIWWQIAKGVMCAIAASSARLSKSQLEIFNLSIGMANLYMTYTNKLWQSRIHTKYTLNGYAIPIISELKLLSSKFANYFKYITKIGLPQFVVALEKILLIPNQ